MRVSAPLLLCLMLVIAGTLRPGAVRAQPLTVFAAASLTDALKDLDEAWRQQGHPGLRLSFGASSTLARQIEQGAPANLFASADEQWMDYLEQRGQIATGTRRDMLANRLVLIVPATQPRRITLTPGFDLAALLGPDGRLAVGDPAHVPAGLYAAQALRRLGVWPIAQGRLAPSADVRGALLLVERGEAPAGIVYATDALASTKVMVAATFADSTHDPITYPFAVTKSGDTPQARALLGFLATPEAHAIFARHGFTAE